MHWLNRHLDHAGRQRIEDAVRAAEAKTNGEIIPVVARRSARYGHAPWLAAALVLAAAEGSGLSWARCFGAGHSAWLSAPLDLVSAGFLGWLLAHSAAIRRALTPPKDRVQAVHRSAEAAFHHLALHRARGDAGVLLYVSLEERRAVVLAGNGILDLAGPEHWNETCGFLIQGARRGDLASGFDEAIAHAAKVMEVHHPSVAGMERPVISQRLRILHESF